MNNKYIIKNCPCRMELHENDCFGHTGYNNCCACTDCVLKQIVQVCNEYSDKWEDYDFSNGLSDEILELLDMQEYE